MDNNRIKNRGWLSIVSLVFGILALSIAIVPNLAGIFVTGKVKFQIYPVLFLGVLSLITGIIAMIKIRKQGGKRIFALLGIIFGGISIATAVILIAFASYTSEARGEEQLEHYRACDLACSEKYSNESLRNSCATVCYQVYLNSGEEAFRQMIGEIKNKTS